MKMLTRGKSETPPCSPWLCESKNALGEMAPTERRPPKWRLGYWRLGVTGGLAKSWTAKSFFESNSAGESCRGALKE